jgi:hypothetical protein
MPRQKWFYFRAASIPRLLIDRLKTPVLCTHIHPHSHPPRTLPSLPPHDDPTLRTASSIFLCSSVSSFFCRAALSALPFSFCFPPFSLSPPPAPFPPPRPPNVKSRPMLAGRLIQDGMGCPTSSRHRALEKLLQFFETG